MKKRILIITLVLSLILSLSLYGCEPANNNLPENMNNEEVNDVNDSNDNTNNEANNETNETTNNTDNNEVVEEEVEEEVEDTTEVVEESTEEETDEAVEVDDGKEKRADVADDYKWDLEKVYASTDAFMADVEYVRSIIPTLEANKDTFTSDYETFKTTLDAFQEVRRMADKIYVFASLQAHTDTRNTDFSDLEDIAAQVDNELNEATSYFLPSIVALDEATLTSYLESDDMDDYRPYVADILKDKEHILSEEEEAILAQAANLFEIPESIYDAFKYQTDFTEYLPEPDWTKFWSGKREDKRDALEAYYLQTEIGIDLIAEIYESEIKKNTFFAEASNYDSALDAALAADGVTLEEYNKVFEITQDNVHLLHRWIDLKKDVLELDDMHIYDLYSPIIDNPYSWTDYESGKELIYEALAPLGDQYIADLEYGFENRWLDVVPTSGKYEGGYQWGTYDTDPFVLLNFNGFMTDVSTAAHEMGHALNFKYSNDTQGYFTSGISIFNAEIASTTNEALVFEYRVANAKNNTQKQQALLNYIELIENTIFTQMIYADFEKRAYEAYNSGEPISSEVFNQIMGDVYQEYYGENFVVDDMATYQWAEIPHFYNAYYVYKYATGLSAGLSFSDKILNGTDKDLQLYLTYLAAGSSEPSLDLLRNAGVDFSTGAPLQNAYDRFESLLDEFEATLN